MHSLLLPSTPDGLNKNGDRIKRKRVSVCISRPSDVTGSISANRMGVCVCVHQQAVRCTRAKSPVWRVRGSGKADAETGITDKTRGLRKKGGGQRRVMHVIFSPARSHLLQLSTTTTTTTTTADASQQDRERQRVNELTGREHEAWMEALLFPLTVYLTRASSCFGMRETDALLIHVTFY